MPRDREPWLSSVVGRRVYYATRFLSHLGFAARNLSGGYTTYKTLDAAQRTMSPALVE